jgi:hypothetical protein
MPAERTCALLESVLAFNDVKLEHLTPEQQLPRDRGMGGADVATIERLAAGTRVDAREAVAVGGRVVQVLQRDIDAAGGLGRMTRAQLRSVLFAAWLDGLIVGARHQRDLGDG